MNNIRTRFAPSPTGYMHIGNLRTALFAYLYTKANNGDFILRIEDTDQNRFVEGATQVIYDTLRVANIKHDEGPDIGGKYGPYIQSERKSIYKQYAEQLVEQGDAYYCFCQKDPEKEEEAQDSSNGYDRRCRNLTKEQINENLNAGRSYVIRQRIPLEGNTSWDDLVYGRISVENNTLDDQILLKSDGMPTYNFANVIDDHLMGITHVIRGSEYLSSNPKYLLLYKAFGWNTPEYIHLPLICGRNEDGTVSKLSKRHGAVSFQALIEDGYLPEAIINYIALLGWNPGTEQEIFTLDELIYKFSTQGIHKNQAIFDYNKLDWVNSEHIKKLDHETFKKEAFKFSGIEGTILESKWDYISTLVQSRIQKYSQIPEMIKFMYQIPQYSTELYINKKNKSTFETSRNYIQMAIECINSIQDWNIDVLNSSFMDLSANKEIKIGQLMWPIRVAVSGLTITPGSAPDIMYVIGKEESIKRLESAIEVLP